MLQIASLEAYFLKNFLDLSRGSCSLGTRNTPAGYLKFWLTTSKSVENTGLMHSKRQTLLSFQRWSNFFYLELNKPLIYNKVEKNGDSDVEKESDNHDNQDGFNKFDLRTGTVRKKAQRQLQGQLKLNWQMQEEWWAKKRQGPKPIYY